MRYRIGTLALATFLVIPMVGCRTGISKPRWDFWRTAKNDTPAATAIANSSATLPSQTAQPQTPGSTLAGSPYGSTTYPAASMPSYNGASNTIASSGGYPGTPYPSTTSPGGSYPGYSPTASAGNYGAPAATTYPAAPTSYPATNYPSTSTPGAGRVAAQVGPYNPQQYGGGSMSAGSSDRYASAPAATTTAPSAGRYPQTNVYDSATVYPSTSGVAVATPTITTPAITTPAPSAGTGDAALGPRYGNTGAGATNSLEAQLGAAPVARPPTPAYTPGATGYQPGATGYNPPNTPVYQTPAYQMPGTVQAPQQFRPGSTTSYLSTGATATGSNTAQPASATVPVMPPTSGQVPPPGYQPPTYPSTGN